MKTVLAKGSGFCQGVRRADEALNKLIKENEGARIFTLGSIIHNRIYNEALAERGVRAVSYDEIAQILDGCDERIILVGRTHGITKEEEAALRALEVKHPGFTFHDMTCPFVKRVHKIAEENTGDNTLFLLYSDPGHPEAVSTLSYAKGEKLPFSSIDELGNVKFDDKIPILSAQTTQNLLEFQKIKLFLKKVCTNAIFFDTICNVTEKRQEEAISIAEASDAMIVVGGKESSNTRKLYDLCAEKCERTVWIESADELKERFPNGAKCVGITAGASTPDGIILEVLKTMEREIDFKSMLEDSLKTLHTGETVTGTVVTIGKNEIKLDLGTKFTGVLAKEQITDDPAANLSEMFKVGDSVDVFVIRVEDGKGLATLSKKRVDADNSWVILKDAHENGTVLEGKVVSVIKGGVLVSVSNNTVFVPASQTGVAKGGDLSTLVGTTQKIKLLEYDVAKKKALGSIKAILVEEKKAAEEAAWAKLEVGQHYMGTVKNLAAYGAFVDIGGVDGMVHNTELSYKRIKHPSQVVSVGQVIDVYIKELDAENKKISLGYKTQEMDTWFQFTQKYQVGDIVPAKIVSIMPFGAFAEVYEDVDGLIHISRISSQRINSPADVLSVGQVVDVKITEIDDENRKLALSIRAITEAAEKAAAEEAKAAEAAAKAEEEAAEVAERAEMAPYIVGSID